MELMDRMRDPELLNALSLGDKLLGSFIVMILGLAVCMIVLFTILLIIKLLRFMSGKEKTEINGAAYENVQPANTVIAEDDGEVVAAIVAAVTLMQDGRPFYIKNIQAAPERDSWSQAGIAQAHKSRKK